MLAVLLFRVALVALWHSTQQKGGLTVLKLTRLFQRAPAPTLKLAAAVAPPPVRQSLCTECVYAHVARAYEPGEEIVLCGYAFPPRDILFPVRECTDFRPKRATNGTVSMAEAVVCLDVPRKEKAGFRFVIAAGEDENENVLVES
jgi:hypothetical protein